jgi:hypothetical protein
MNFSDYDQLMKTKNVFSMTQFQLQNFTDEIKSKEIETEGIVKDVEHRKITLEATGYHITIDFSDEHKAYALSLNKNQKIKVVISVYHIYHNDYHYISGNLVSHF